MSAPDRVTLDRLVTLLAPLLPEEGSRRAFVTRALGRTAVVHHIDWSGSASVFTTNLITLLAERDAEVAPEMPPLVALLEACREAVGTDRQAEINELVAAVRVATREALAGGAVPDSPRPAAPVAELRERYLTLMAAEWNQLRLVGMDPQAGDPYSRRAVTLEQVYVDLDTTTPRQHGSEQHPGDAELLSALEALCAAPKGRMVLLGRPGSGKSTFARRLALELVLACADPRRDMTRSLPSWDGWRGLPVLVSLGRLAQALPSHGEPGAATVEAHIRADLDSREDLRGYGAALLLEIRSEGGLVLLDGLDEVAETRRAAVKQAVSRFADLYRKCRVLVTCRTHSYRADPGWHLDWPAVHELAPFGRAKIRAFIEAWYATLARLDPRRGEDYFHDKRDALAQALAPGEPRRLAELAETPLLLTIMALVHTDKGDLPDSRVEVFKACVDTLLLRWHTERTPGAGVRSLLESLAAHGVRRVNLYQALLWEMAYEATLAGERDPGRGGEGRALVSEGNLHSAMHRHLGDAALKIFIEYCQGANGLLLFEGKVRRPYAAPDAPLEAVYNFPHLALPGVPHGTPPSS